MTRIGQIDTEYLHDGRGQRQIANRFCDTIANSICPTIPEVVLLSNEDLTSRTQIAINIGCFLPFSGSRPDQSMPTAQCEGSAYTDIAVYTLKNPWQDLVNGVVNCYTSVVVHAGDTWLETTTRPISVRRNLTFKTPQNWLKSPHNYFWIEQAIELERNGKTEESIDVIFDHIDDLLLDSRFDECDEAIRAMPIDRMTNGQLITVLTATADAKMVLQSRADFYRRTKAALVAKSAHADNLLFGLE